MTQPTKQPDETNITLYIFGGVAAAIILGLGMFFVLRGSIAPATTPDANAQATPYRGTAITPPRDLTDFTLTSHTGEPLSLSDLRGRVVLLLFGYTHCPDVCPISLGVYQEIKKLLGDDAGKVAFVFVSVDSERDTPEQLNLYLGNLDTDFVGLSGQPEVLDAIASEYGLYYEIHDDGLIDHTATMFMINKDGQLVRVFSYGTDAATIADVVRESF